ncbi:MAG: hypothetical protein RLZZ312_1520 [Bacteroidota bacterium]|jgi:XTP/dITP diphosphohydrolase
MEIVFASNNANKIFEIQSMLPPEIEILSLESIGCFDEIAETSDTIEGNAIQKANYVLEKYGYDCFADDTGLEVEVLNGEPGVFSARYAGAQRDANDNMSKLLANLEHHTNRTAGFKTVICLNINGQQHLFEGVVNGSIRTKKSGTGGFGYDPIFEPAGFDKTFAELSLAVKNEISHRGIATKKLIDFLRNNPA